MIESGIGFVSYLAKVLAIAQFQIPLQIPLNIAKKAVTNFTKSATIMTASLI